jgi:hypothetical protein
MTTEDLLKPRYKVIADWPFQNYAIDEILQGDEAALISTKYDKSNLYDYPALFRKLNWWEERDVKDLPKFVNINGAIYEARWAHSAQKGFHILSPFCWNTYEDSKKLPATEQEYKEFIASKLS